MNVAQVLENMNLGPLNWGPESFSSSSPHLQPQSPPRLLMPDNTEGNPPPTISAPEGDDLAFHVHIEPPPLMSVASTALPSTTLADLNFTGYYSSDLDLPQSSPLSLDNNAGQTGGIGSALEDSVLMNEVSLSHPQPRLDPTNTSPRRSSFGSHTTEGQLKKFSFGPPPGSAEFDTSLLSAGTDLQRSQPDVEGGVTDSIPNSMFLSPAKQREHQHSRSLSSGVTFLSVPGLVSGSQTTAASSTRLSTPNASPSLHYNALNRRRQMMPFISPVRGDSEDKPLLCKWAGCGKRFSRNYDAKRHEQLHTNYQPFTCDGCNDCFVRMDDLNQHRNVECHGTSTPDFIGAKWLILEDT
ncbi:hypothetical protein MVEN_02130000 [Mycena venus]|uniref:C2H2-type domain-containing protein n=1 Tax=Mycena venus TaxID=2733690 RepID=A0A8H6XA86_9AGAR|nr:hypothetical protein MVEN_02130000 [Mycena venus]